MYTFRYFTKTILLTILISISLQGNSQNTDNPYIDTIQYKKLSVNPSLTNPAIYYWDTSHVVYYDSGIKSNKILLWLAGTNGIPLNVPVDFFNTALSQGYRIVALSYITVPAIAQVCVGDVLDSDIDCAARFRQRRIYGDNDFSLIRDEPQDAIIPRFFKLLQWLEKNDADGNWSQYINTKESKPMWNKIVIAGQSQGGGMAAFIGQHETLAGVISFSGGWDYSNSKEKKIAAWYFNKAQTPLKNWYVTYHVNEMAAKQLKEISTSLKVPETHIFALDKPLLNENASKERTNPYHGDGIRNIAYKPIWITMLGKGVYKK